MQIALKDLDFTLPDVRRIPPPPAADQALKASIAARGVLQALLVRPRGNRYEIVLGRRRARASIELGRETIEAECRDMTDLQALEAQVIENQQRAQMHPIDQWKATKLLLEAGAPVEDAAMALGLDARAAARMAKLAQLHPDVEALVLQKMPDTRDLAAIAAAPPERQVQALKVPYADGFDGPNWHVIANACRRTMIARVHAIFDVKTAGVLFEEDLFAEPGSPAQFVTYDVARFMVAQREALMARVDAAQKRGERVQLVEAGERGINIPAGWARKWTEVPTTWPKSGPMVLVAIGQASHDYGEIVTAWAEPPGNAARAAAEASGLLGTTRTPAAAAAAAPEAAIDPEALTKRGLTMIAARKTQALRDALRDAPGAQELTQIATCLALAIVAADNVSVSSENKWSKTDFRDLLPLLVDESGHLASLSGADLVDLLGEVLARILQVTDPATGYGSGRAAEWIGHALDVPVPRFDDVDFLATLPGDELRRIARAHYPDCPTVTTVAALRQALTGKLAGWRPTTFGAPGPIPAPRSTRTRKTEMADD